MLLLLGGRYRLMRDELHRRLQIKDFMKHRKTSKQFFQTKAIQMNLRVA